MLAISYAAAAASPLTRVRRLSLNKLGRRAHVMFVSSSAAGASKPAGPKRVLLTNDDGPDSPFFYPFAERLKKLGWDVFVCIPATNASFIAKGITAYKPLTVTHVSPHEVHISGSPASCVNLALSHLVPECDLVISGPNIGHNVGRASVVSSGTIGAAAEGVLYGRKGIAVSFPFFNGWGNWTDADVEDAVNVSAEARVPVALAPLSEQLWEEWERSPAGGVPELFNVNVPVTRTRADGAFVADAGNATGMRDGSGSSGAAGGAEGQPSAEVRPAGTASLGAGVAALWAHGKATIAGAEVHLTIVDQTSYYGSLYAPQDAEGGAASGKQLEPDTVMGSAVAPPTSVYKWQPTKLRPFDGPTPIVGGDVACVRDGNVSVTPLGATLQHMTWK